MKQSRTSEQREADRYAVQNLICDSGVLIDLSQKGACLERHTHWPIGMVRRIGIRSGEQQLSVEAECIHIEEVEPNLHRVGLHFIRVTSGQRAMLEQLAAGHSGY